MVREASDSWSDRWGLVACLLLALAVRGVAMFARAEELTHDRDAYLGIAHGIAAGRGMCSPDSTTPTAFRPPLYPTLLGLLMVTLPTSVAVGLVNAVAGVVTVWATFRAGESLGLGRASLIAAALVALDPMLLLYGTQPMTESVCAGLVSLLILAVVGCPESLNRPLNHDPAGLAPVEFGLCTTRTHLSNEGEEDEEVRRSASYRGMPDGVSQRQVDQEIPRSRFGLVCSRSSGDRFRVGVLFGLLVLCRPTFWPLLGVLAVGCIFRTPQLSLKSLPWRVIAGTLLVVAPWVIRNQLVIGLPLLTTTHGGYTLLLANNSVFSNEVVDQPWGTVWSGESLARWQAGLDERLERELGPNASELERDHRLSQWGREFIAAEPLRFARAVWHRVRSLWSVVPHGDGDGEGGPSRLVIAAVGGFYSILLLGFAVGMFVVARRSEWSRWWLLYALVITVQGVHLVYWTNARMRAPLTPVIALFAVAAVERRAKRLLSDE